MDEKRSNEIENLEIAIRSHYKETHQRLISKEILYEFINQIKSGKFSLQDVISSINNSINIDKTIKFLCLTLTSSQLKLMLSPAETLEM